MIELTEEEVQEIASLLRRAATSLDGAIAVAAGKSGGLRNDQAKLFDMERHFLEEIERARGDRGGGGTTMTGAPKPFEPDYAVHPGATVLECFLYQVLWRDGNDHRGETGRFGAIIRGEAGLTEDDIDTIIAVLGNSSPPRSFWQNLQKNYDEAVERLAREKTNLPEPLECKHRLECYGCEAETRFANCASFAPAAPAEKKEEGE